MKQFLALILTLFVFSTKAQNKDISYFLKTLNNASVPYISVNELKEMENTPILLDARAYKEYKVSKLKSAFWVGYEKFKLKKTIAQLPNKKDTIVVYCSIGVRSEDISERLVKAGYKNVFNLYGGIFDWKNENNTVVDKNNKPTEKVHAYDSIWGLLLKKGEKVYD